MTPLLITLGGSRAYGTFTDSSDTDVRGFFIPSQSERNHLFKKIELISNRQNLPDWLNQQIDLFLQKHRYPDVDDIALYTLEKFFRLLADCNPNIIEIIWTDDSHSIYQNKQVVNQIRDAWPLFVSTRKLCSSFVGYALAQLYKLERHRKWILMGEVKKPERKEFGLPPEKITGTDEIFAHINKELSRWELDSLEVDNTTRLELKELIWEIIYYFTRTKITWDNWVDEYQNALIEKICNEASLDRQISEYLKREHAYRKALNEYKSWIKWKNERNPERRELELKCGYDSKHAMHLIRLMRMCYEIITTGKVNVLRPDAKELLEIRNGKWTYEKVIEEATNIKGKIEAVNSPRFLNEKPDFEKINELYHKIINSLTENC